MIQAGKVRASLQLATRLTLVVGLAVTAVAGPPATGAVAAQTPDGGSLAPAPPDEIMIQATTCHAVKASVSGARGSCDDPAPHLSFKVIATCRHAVTGQQYRVESPLVPTSDVAFVNCAQSAFIDPILSWDTEIVQTGPAPPVIHFFFCEHIGIHAFRCSLSASNWTQIRWFYNGSARTAWNNQTSVFGSCSGRPAVEARVSNAHGTVQHKSFFDCEGPIP